MFCSLVINLIKRFPIVIYNSRVVWLENYPYYDSRVVIYARKMFLRLATDLHFLTQNISALPSIEIYLTQTIIALGVP